MLEKARIEEFCLRLERDHPGVPAATIMQHFYTLFNEREDIGRKMGRLWEYVERMARQDIPGDKHYENFVAEHGDDYEPDWEGGFEHAVREARRLTASINNVPDKASSDD